MYFIGYDPVGKTLGDILREKEVDINNAHGVCIYLITQDDAHDMTGRHLLGKPIAEDFSLLSILTQRPWLMNAVVISHNDFFGEDVYRVRLPE